MRSPANRRTRSSSAERKKRDSPGSPWRPERPRSWLSMRRDSWRSVPRMYRPPSSVTPSASLMSTPRPAMFVAIVTAPTWPASLMISASRSCCLAFSTLCVIPRRSSSCDRYSETSTEIVPTSTGWPFSWRSAMSSDHGLELLVARLVDEVVLVEPHHRLVRRDRGDAELVDLVELVRLGERRAGHAGELLVQAEVVLDRDRRDRDVLGLDLHALLGLDGLVQALRPAPALHDAAGELVDDLDLAILHDVLDVALVQRLGLERLHEVVDELAVLGGVQVLDLERALDLVHALLARRDRLALLVDLEVVRHAQRARDLRERVVRVGRLLGLARDDQRRPRLVDQDRVDLVDDRVGVAALDALVDVVREVVAQVVEAELRVGAVGDVALVLGAPTSGRILLDHADGHAERLVDRPHPLGVAAGEVVVHRDQVDALAGQRVQVDRQRRDERLALTRAHLGDRALVQHRPAEQLHVEVAHPERALRRLADRANASGRRSSSSSPCASRSRNSAVLPRSSSSLSAAYSSSSALTSRTVLSRRRRVLPSPARRILLRRSAIAAQR